jgi:hypothetical protein
MVKHQKHKRPVFKWLRLLFSIIFFVTSISITIEVVAPGFWLPFELLKYRLFNTYVYYGQFSEKEAFDLMPISQLSDELAELEHANGVIIIAPETYRSDESWLGALNRCMIVGCTDPATGKIDRFTLLHYRSRTSYNYWRLLPVLQAFANQTDRTIVITSCLRSHSRSKVIYDEWNSQVGVKQEEQPKRSAHEEGRAFDITILGMDTQRALRNELLLSLRQRLEKSRLTRSGIALVSNNPVNMHYTHIHQQF